LVVEDNADIGLLRMLHLTDFGYAVEVERRGSPALINPPRVQVSDENLFGKHQSASTLAYTSVPSIQKI
jgi:hypothetical protein